MNFFQSGNNGKKTLGIFARATAISLALLFIAAPAFAATIVVPNDLATAEGNYNNLAPFGVGIVVPSMRYQQVFAASDFGVLSTPELITQISFRLDNGPRGPFSTTLTNVQINLSTTAAAPDGLSSTFAVNVGSDDTVVLSGALSLSSADTGPPGGPNPFDVIINLDTPFLYNPSKGNLLLDVRIFDAGETPTFDAVRSLSDPVSSVFSSGNGSVNDASGVNATSGLVAQFTTIPVPPLPKPVPTLHQWSLMLLALMLGMVGIARVRRKV